MPEKKIALPAKMMESSGMEWINDSVWVTHNDSGNEAKLFYLTAEGKLIDTSNLINTPNIDWEDIAFDGKEYIYIADLGNNLHNRKNLKIHRFSLIDSSEKSFPISYKNQKFPIDSTDYNYDCEAMAFLNGQLYLFSKNNTDPYNGICRMYIFNSEKKDTSLLIKDSLCLGLEGYWKNSVTAADFSSDGKKLAILTYGYLFIFYDFNGDDFLKGKYMRFRLPEIQQREAVSFGPKNNIFITDENSRLSNGGFLYFYNMENIWKGNFYFREPELEKIKIKKKKTKPSAITREFYTIKYKVNSNEEISFRCGSGHDGSLCYAVPSTKKGKGKMVIENGNSPLGNFIQVYAGNKLIYSNLF